MSKGKEEGEGKLKGSEGRGGGGRDIAHPKNSMWCPLWPRDQQSPDPDLVVAKQTTAEVQ